MGFADLQSIFAGITKKNILYAEPMTGHTSFHIGGNADALAMPSDTEELSKLLERAVSNDIPVTLIGNGSNILVRDGGIRGLVIKLGNALKGSVTSGQEIIFGSGISLAAAAAQAAKLGLTGMEFAAGIPGTIGGAVYMNAGAYGGEMADIVRSVTVMDMNGELQEIGAEHLAFAYRKTALQNSGYIVTTVRIALTPGDPQAILAKINDFAQRRISKQPLELPSAGSIFKRPAGFFAGTLIEQAGLKGYAIGGAQISPKHAGFIVNVNHAKAKDVLDLIEYVQKQVLKFHGVFLEPEVLILGEDCIGARTCF